MKKYVFEGGLKYYQYENEELFYNAITELLDKGYQIKNNIFLSVLLENNNERIILGYQDIDNKNDIFKELTKNYNNIQCILPDYSNTFLNIISDIRNNFGYKSKIKCSNNNLFDKKYSKVVILLLDGLGVNILKNNLSDESFLNRHYFSTINSIFPSTTAAATTSFKSGKSPIETGWTGWSNYIKEINKSIVLFTGNDYKTNEPTGLSGYKLMPYEMFYSDMNNVCGYSIEPDFSRKKHKIDEVLKKSLKTINKSVNTIQYVYYTEPDSIMHEFGPYSKEAKDVLKQIDKKIEKYANKLPNDTLLIISADHGHIGVKPLALYKCEAINRLLNRSPANDSRCITFSVKQGKDKEFEAVFNGLFGSVYKLYKTEDAIKQGFFGSIGDEINPRINDFLADYVAFATNEYYFIYEKGKDDFVFKSHHAGITKEEMEVPIIVLRK